MQDMQPVSLGADDIRAIKKEAVNDAPYAERISLGLAIRLLEIRQSWGEDHTILREIDDLENMAADSSTKDAEQFKRAPLHPFWHKHFFITAPSCEFPFLFSDRV